MTAAAQLTPRQRGVLDIIAEHVERHGWAPTRREMMDALGITSRAALEHHLAELRRKGRIESGLGARAIRICQAAVGGA